MRRREKDLESNLERHILGACTPNYKTPRLRCCTFCGKQLRPFQNSSNHKPLLQILKGVDVCIILTLDL